MKKRFFNLLIILSLLFSSNFSKADLFGGDVAVLTQILAQAIQQLITLKDILGTGKDTLNLIQEINQGINDSLNILKKIDPNLDPGIYRDWEKVSDAVRKIQQIYGDVINSPEARIQKDADQSVAEAISFNNDFYKWSSELDRLGEDIKNYSHLVSPGGAQKLTAQALGIMIQVMNQNLRAQATSLKLQAQTMAIENRKEKEAVKEMLGNSGLLKQAMKAEKAAYQIPRF